MKGFDLMKIATFNIWNSDRGMPFRQPLIVKELKAVNSDIICLQEVKSEMYQMLTTELDNYPYSFFQEHLPEYDGLVIFSKYPIIKKDYSKCALYITIEFENYTYLIINVHLPSDSIMQQEQLIVEILKNSEKFKTDYAFLTGDFNCSDNSSVHRFITGQSTLMNIEATPYWNDLAEVEAEVMNTKPEFTLNLRTNPRWRGRNFAVKSERVDRIYNKDAFPKPFPELKFFSLFGKEIDEKSGYSASDHYGVVAEISIIR